MLEHGFTLPEVMNFVALAAILSALAMYGLAYYVKRSKTQEASDNLRIIAARAATYYETSDSNQPVGTSTDAAHAMRHFPPSSKTSVPPSTDLVKGQKYRSADADWAASPWRELHFSISQPQCYTYSFESEGSGAAAKATITAQGDLDGDGHLSTYRLTITPDSSFKARVAEDVESADALE
jgi:Tfp pilus assembly protein PilE